MSSAEDFAAESLAAERRGDFSPYLAETRPAARSLVRRLLASYCGGTTPLSRAPLSAEVPHGGPAAPAGGALIDILANLAAPLFGASGAGAAFAGAAEAVGAAAMSPAVAAAAAAASLLSGGGGSEGEASAAKSASSGRAFITLNFRSVQPDDPDGRWTADLRVPVSGEGNAVVRLRVPRRGTGTFTFCGSAVPISGGRGELPLAKFRAGLSRGGVAFARPGASPVPGTPFLEAPEQ